MLSSSVTLIFLPRRQTLKRLTFVCLACVAALSFAIESAQAAEESSWQKDTEARLRAIYERGEFRGRRFQAEWLPDSSGYVVGERDPETEQPEAGPFELRVGTDDDSLDVFEFDALGPHDDTRLLRVAAAWTVGPRPATPRRGPCGDSCCC